LVRKTCNVCNRNIVHLELTKEQKYYLVGAIKQDLKLFAARKISSEFGLTKDESNIIIEHLNYPYGKCTNCNFDKLYGEKIECPNCGKFNYNLSDPYVHKKLSSHPEWCLHFCSHLEWSLNFSELDDKSVNHFWCDGIEEFPTKEIVSNGETNTAAWIGSDGQEKYKMKFLFGPKSISNFKIGLDLKECIPNHNANEWIEIDPEEKKILVRLN